MRRAAVALLRAARTQGSYPAPLQASVVSAALLANPPLPRPVHNRSWASASAADGGSTESAADTLAPCERQPEKQQANELDERLAAAGRAGDTPVVLATVEAEGERFGELNVVSALSALGEAAERNGGGGMSPEEVKRSPAFQALVGEPALVGVCMCCPAHVLPCTCAAAAALPLPPRTQLSHC